MNENIIINNENINLNQNNYICQLCNRQIINQVKCLSCKNIFCQICFENYNNKIIKILVLLDALILLLKKLSIKKNIIIHI